MRYVLLILTLAVAGACADTQANAANGGTDDTDAAAYADTATGAVPSAGAGGATGESEMIHNTPEGGVLDWVADIDAGLDSVPVLVGSDPAAAQGTVLNLYVLRQEYLEGYYGPGGRLEATPELADAIDANEARFHALMGELSRESPDSARVVALTDSLEEQTARVGAAARAVDRELTPWTGGGS